MRTSWRNYAPFKPSWTARRRPSRRRYRCAPACLNLPTYLSPCAHPCMLLRFQFFFLLISSSTFRPCCARRLAVQLAQRRQRRQRRPVRPTLRTCVRWSHGCRLPPPAPSLAPRLPRIPLAVLLLQVVAPVESPSRASWPRAGILFWKFISVRT